MSELLARLNGPPFPGSDSPVSERSLTHASAVDSQASTVQVPGPFQAPHQTSGNDIPSRDMLAMLCEQVALLADTQARERERLERDKQNNLDVIRQSVLTMSQRLDAASQLTGGLPTSSASQAQDSRPLITQTLASDTVPSDPPSTSNPRLTTRTPMTHPLPAGGSQPSHPSVPEASTSGPTLTPQELSLAEDPVRTLRRHRPSANHATAILKELALLEAGSKKRKGGHGYKNCNTQVEADWPDLYVYRLGGNEPTYDSLSMAEFVAGYLSIMEEATTVCSINNSLLQHISYLRQLMEDSFMTDWHIVRTAHKHVLNAIEHRRFTWDDTDRVMETKRIALIHIHNSNLNVNSSQSTQALVTPPPIPPLVSGPTTVCVAYQQLACPLADDNDVDVDGVTHHHCCNFCFAVNGWRHTHPQAQCRKAKEAKNGRSRNRSNKRQKKE